MSEIHQTSQVGQARYSIGIDLGTTHCALSWVDRRPAMASRWCRACCRSRRLTGPGAVEARPLLPSFLYLPHESELAPETWACPGARARTMRRASSRARAARRRRSAWSRAPRAGSAIRRGPALAHPAGGSATRGAACLAAGGFGALSVAPEGGLEPGASGSAVRAAAGHGHDSGFL